MVTTRERMLKRAFHSLWAILHRPMLPSPADEETVLPSALVKQTDSSLRQTLSFLDSHWSVPHALRAGNISVGWVRPQSSACRSSLGLCLGGEQSLGRKGVSAPLAQKAGFLLSTFHLQRRPAQSPKALSAIPQNWPQNLPEGDV